MTTSPICLTVTGAAVAAPYTSSITSLTSSCVPRPKLVGSCIPKLSIFASFSRVSPAIIGILATSDAPSRAYAQWTQKACEAVGIEYELRELERAEGMEKASEDMVEEAILQANGDKEVDGIMVYVGVFPSCGEMRMMRMDSGWLMFVVFFLGSIRSSSCIVACT